MTSSKKIMIVFILNLCFSIIEFIYGNLFLSGAILADSIHDLGDAIAIGFSAFLEKTASRNEDSKFSLGYKRFSLLGALITSLILLSGSSWVIIENVPKLWNPKFVDYQGMTILSIIAIFVNSLARITIHSGKTKNEEILNLHFLEDILGWIAILILSLILNLKPWYFLDPLLSILISIFILSKATPKFISNFKIFLDGVPDSINYQSLSYDLKQVPHIKSINQLNIWSMDGIDNKIIIHCCLTNYNFKDECKQSIRQICKNYNVSSITIEIDTSLEDHKKLCNTN
ncbi:cation diffusion facilitator family transporter [Streptococcus dysgalactiae]|uniref:cation diffusion facilitator family transporter n=1 Tax=Streptococcus dysgalactiae TaxID=1334 RepID=UPI003DA18DE9